MSKDFGYIRAYTAAIRNPATTWANRQTFQYLLSLRQDLTLRDIGVFSHYAADASQPMHVSVHSNGWGNYPNPNNYTQSPIHAPFDGNYPKVNVNTRMVAQKIPEAPSDCRASAGPIETDIVNYLTFTVAGSDPGFKPGLTNIQLTYEYAKPEYTNLWVKPNATGTAFVSSRMAAGATQTRDMIVKAWCQSTKITVGYPVIPVADIESGRVILTPELLWSD